MRGKIRLRYRLIANGKLIAAGEESLSDQLYMSRPGAALSSDELRYEREHAGRLVPRKIFSGPRAGPLTVA